MRNAKWHSAVSVCSVLAWNLPMLMMCWWCGQLKQTKKQIKITKQQLICGPGVCSCACSSGVWCDVWGLIFMLTDRVAAIVHFYSTEQHPLSAPVTLGGLEMRRHHLTCVATAGTAGSWVNARDAFFFFFFGEIHPKQLADWRYLIVALNTVITKLSVKFLREYKQNNELQGREGGIASCVLAVWRLKEWTYE